MWEDKLTHEQNNQHQKSILLEFFCERDLGTCHSVVWKPIHQRKIPTKEPVEIVFEILKIETNENTNRGDRFYI